MKSSEKVQKLLFKELLKCFTTASSLYKSNYYNEQLGKVSMLLSRFLQETLKCDYDWDSNKWIDDCLLTKIKITEYKFSIWDIAIWGEHNTTMQCTEPLYFEMLFNQDFGNFTTFSFLFGDTKEPAIVYEAFNQDRGFWDKDFYSSSEWNPAERDWTYFIKGKD